MINIFIQNQTLEHIGKNVLTTIFSISSSSRGLGQIKGSYCTPLGEHTVRAKIGTDVPKYGIFKARRWTGDVWNKNKDYDSNDLILSRILWLSGTKVGFNRLGDVDTMQRFIYIHGTHEEEKIGQPASHGCIRMLNEDVIILFHLVSIGERVLINE